MCDTAELNRRLIDLESRHTHQEAALDELTRTVLVQEDLIRKQADRIECLEKTIRALQGGMAISGVDEKPPHY